MLISHTIGAGIGAVALASWIYLLFARGFFWRITDESAPVATPPLRRVTAVIPARDEAETIAGTVTSLRTQSAASALRIIVVDDHSSDGTAALARDAGAEVVSAKPLPGGWTGKLWAVSQGVDRALDDPPDYFLLTDADIEHAPDSLAALVSRVERDHLDLASFMVRLHCATAAEKLLIPAFVFFFLKLYPPRWIADPQARTAGAAGGCILIRNSALDRIGGIAAIRGELIDDCALAAAVKTGGPIWMGLTATTHSTRVYRNFGEIRAMIARTAFTQLQHSTLLLLGTAAGMALLYLAAPVLTFSGDRDAAALGSLTWIAMCVAYAPSLRLYKQPLWQAPLLPLTAIFYLIATIESAIRYWTGTGGMWKGRAQDHR